MRQFEVRGISNGRKIGYQVNAEEGQEFLTQMKIRDLCQVIRQRGGSVTEVVEVIQIPE